MDHNFNKLHSVLPGTKISLYFKPGNKNIWAFHGDECWYVEPAPSQYMCVTCYIPKTHRDMVIDTAQLIPRQVNIPNASIEDNLRRTSDELVHLIYH